MDCLDQAEKKDQIYFSFPRKAKRASLFFLSLDSHKTLVSFITFLKDKSMDDMDSVVPRALKGSSREYRQTRERSNGQFLINSTLCEDSHVLTGYGGK